MKTYVPAVAIAISSILSVSAPPAIASGPDGGEIYGRALLTLDRWDRESDTPAAEFREWQLNSNNSRLGLRGEAELNPGLALIYQMEFGVAIDGDGSTFSTRNSFVGLRGAYGSILAGKYDTPTKLIQDNIDQFDNLPGDIKSIFEGDNRLNDVVFYRSPLLADSVTVSFAFIPGEDAADGDRYDGVEGDRLADGKSFSIEYTPSASLLLALGIDRSINGFDLERLAAKYTVGNFQVGAMAEFYESNDEGEPVDMRAGMIGLSYTLGQNVFKVQAGLADSRIDDARRETYSIGYDYKLAQSSRAVSYITVNKDEDAFGIQNRETIVGIGLEHRF